MVQRTSHVPSYLKTLAGHPSRKLKKEGLGKTTIKWRKYKITWIIKSYYSFFYHFGDIGSLLRVLEEILEDVKIDCIRKG